MLGHQNSTGLVFEVYYLLFFSVLKSINLLQMFGIDMNKFSTGGLNGIAESQLYQLRLETLLHQTIKADNITSPIC